MEASTAAVVSLPNAGVATAASWNNSASSFFVENGSYLRLQNIQLSYNFPKKLLGNSFIQKAMVSVSCNNVWLITSHMHGVDPESVYATGTPAVGFENGGAPTSRIYYINLSLGF